MKASSRISRLSFPAMALVVSILATAGFLLATTVRSQRLDRQRMSRDLQREGRAIIRTLEAGARTGMMMRWGREQLQDFLEEAAALPEIAYLAMLEEDGPPIALYRREEAYPGWVDGEDFPQPPEDRETLYTMRSVNGEDIFEIARMFSPVRGRHRQMMGHMGRLASPAVDKRTWTVVVGMKTTYWEKVLREGRRQTMLSFLIILIAGSVALYLGIILQNNLIVRRTLSDMRAYAQNILENMADGLLSVDGEGKVTTFNAEAARLLARREKNLPEAAVNSLLPQAAPFVEAALKRGERTAESEMVLPSDGGGERPVGVSVSPLRSGEGEVMGAVLLLRDLTEVRRLEKKIRDSEKLAAVGQMAATVAHEIRNPLSSIRGFAQLFKSKFAAPSDEAGYARLMVREVDRLNRTIEDLLFFSRPLQARIEAVQIRALVEEKLRLLEPDFSSRKVNTVLEEGEEIDVAADPDLLSRVLINLLVNAREAAPAGSDVSIGVFRDEANCRIEVRDRGEGLTDEEAARAFEPFFTTREKGSGLGLAIVKKILELHGGGVELSGSRGGETVAAVTLPVWKGKEEG